ncbi:MAG: helix-turn-helix domain-containing protein [Candidatus Micrarchaeaceae archaeon]
MRYNCERAMRLTIPAVRVAVSETLVRKHGMSETDVAKGLGIAQAAVSKYINGNYSNAIRKVVHVIVSRGIHTVIVNAVLDRKGHAYISGLIDKAASDKALVEIAA